MMGLEQKEEGSWQEFQVPWTPMHAGQRQRQFVLQRYHRRITIPLFDSFSIPSLGQA